MAVIAGTVLPHLANRDRRLMAHKDDVDEDAELTRIKNTVRQWKAEAARNGKPLRLPMMPFLLRNIWTGALLWFSVLTMSTFFVKTVTQVGYIFRMSSLLNDLSGNRVHCSSRRLLGGSDVGTICNHNGGKSAPPWLRKSFFITL